ncbi:hypothetical protein Tco_0543665 [Tanacetum coccineum]
MATPISFGCVVMHQQWNRFSSPIRLPSVFRNSLDKYRLVWHVDHLSNHFFSPPPPFGFVSMYPVENVIPLYNISPDPSIGGLSFEPAGRIILLWAFDNLWRNEDLLVLEEELTEQKLVEFDAATRVVKNMSSVLVDGYWSVRFEHVLLTGTEKTRPRVERRWKFLSHKIVAKKGKKARGVISAKGKASREKKVATGGCKGDHVPMELSHPVLVLFNVPNGPSTESLESFIMLLRLERDEGLRAVNADLSLHLKEWIAELARKYTALVFFPDRHEYKESLSIPFNLAIQCRSDPILAWTNPFVTAVIPIYYVEERAKPLVRFISPCDLDVFRFTIFGRRLAPS